jgi:cytochrome oxidase Cu insertion factor (SCO1/SenC/PrrC family)
MAFYSWNAIQKASAEATFNKYKKDLYISETSPKNTPPFTLTDQNGKVISLSDFKNKKIVIQPMDPECTDICPLVSKELIDANKQLGSKANNVVYIGLNVNEYHNKVKDVKAFSDQHGLSTLKNWYFLTGSPNILKKIWKAYGIAVVPSKTGDVMHTSNIVFVNSNGKEVYEGTPQNDKSSVEEWSNAISFILKQMS